MIVEIRIGKENIAKWGAGTLIGKVISTLSFPKDFDSITGVTLTFERSNKVSLNIHGPKIWNVAEFSLPCLLEDIIFFQERGVKITLQYIEVS